jgi:hypothetical protein
MRRIKGRKRRKEKKKKAHDPPAPPPPPPPPPTVPHRRRRGSGRRWRPRKGPEGGGARRMARPVVGSPLAPSHQGKRSPPPS